MSARAPARDLLRGIRVAPSILSADFGRLREQVAEVLDAGARVIHVDVMDGHFVPPITVGPIVIAGLREQTGAAGAMLDVHLMIERPQRHVRGCLAAGARVFVAGNAIFGAPEPAAAYREIALSVGAL